MKAKLRRRLRTVLHDLSDAEIHERSNQAAKRFLELKEYASAEVVMTFIAMPHEIDTQAIVLRAWRDGKRVLAPRISWEQRRILPVEIQSYDALTPNKMGIREPIEGPPIPVSYIDLVIVPGLGFDALGNRIGRGSGFYDRFLAQPDYHGFSCGLAFQEQYVDQVPVGPEDRQVDCLVTDENVYRFDKPRKARRPSS